MYKAMIRSQVWLIAVVIVLLVLCPALSATLMYTL